MPIRPLVTKEGEVIQPPPTTTLGMSAWAKERGLLDQGQGGQEIEESRPEPRATVPEHVRGGVFPLKARIVKLQTFENDPTIGDEGSAADDILLELRALNGNEGLLYNGKLVDTYAVGTSALEGIGLATQVNRWLVQANEIDIVDWELDQNAATGYPRFLILYTE